MLNAAILMTLLLTVALGQEPKESAAGDAQKIVTIRGIVVEGTRLAPRSVLGLAQIKAGDQVNFLTLHTAMQKVTSKQLNQEH